MNLLVTDRESMEAGIAVLRRYVVISIHDSRSKKPKVAARERLGAPRRSRIEVEAPLAPGVRLRPEWVFGVAGIRMGQWSPVWGFPGGRPDPRLVCWPIECAKKFA